jgi:penicillin-binding protein 1A
MVSAPAFAYFYKHLLQIHPELIRKFNIPKGVHTYEINGHKELFTKESPPPKQQTFVPVF